MCVIKSFRITPELEYKLNEMQELSGLSQSEIVRLALSGIKAIREKYNLQKNYVWIFFGRPGISKWLIYFVKAIPEIIKKIPNFKAILNVSESVNNKADDVRKFIKENKLEDYIVRLWWVKYKELWNYILSADVAVVPSLVEWFGFAAAETCAIQQQLICSNAAALTEVVSYSMRISWLSKINFSADYFS